MKHITLLLLSLFCTFGWTSAATYENLYVVGSGCIAGWDTGKAIPMTNKGNGMFTWTGILYGKAIRDNGQARFKFLVTRNWSPCFTCQVKVDGHFMLTSEVETDIYEFDGNGKDNAFQVSSSGTYTINVNLNTNKMVCTKISDDITTDLDNFTKESFRASNGETLKYRKLVPIAKENGAKYPLVIVLHGAGERGSDNESQLKYGGELFAKKSNREAYPAYVLFPQCPSNYFWPFNAQPASYTATTFPVDYPVSSAIKQVKELIDSYLAMDDVDKDCVYISGLSMGGMGTFDIVCRFPEIFAAALPICGGINVERLDSKVKDIYWRIFHGGGDGTVTVKNSRDANTKLSGLGANVEYIEFPGVGHDAWNNAFGREDYLSWMFSKTRKSTSGIKNAEEKKIPKIYCGNNHLYLEIEDSGTFRINLYSISGALHHSFTDNNATNDVRKEYPLTFLGKGIYFIEIQTNSNRFVSKICI